MGCYETKAEIEVDKISFLKFTMEKQFEVYAALMKDDYKELKGYVEAGFMINLPMMSFANRTPLHIAAENGKENCLNLLISSGANVNIKDQYQITPLMLALRNKSKDCVKILIQAGARTKGKNSFDESINDFISKSDKEYYEKILHLS